MRIAIVVSFLNEEEYLPRMLGAMGRQTRPPDWLLLVDDGSVDGSPAIARRFAEDHPYAEVRHRSRRPAERDRLATAAELRAFHWGLEQLPGDWDVASKLDADIELTPRSLETLLQAFEANPRLGVAGPYLSVLAEGGRPVRQRGRPEQVAGPAKFYRRACYEEIGPLPEILGWDTMDDIKARMHGWETASVAMPEGDPLHLRPMGTHDGILRAYRRWGVCAYGHGAHPLMVLLMAAQRVGDRPPVLAAANYLYGWTSAAMRRNPRADPQLRAFARWEQLARIRRRLRRLGRAAPA